MDPVNRALWWRATDPATVARTRWFMNWHEFYALLLSGRPVVDWSDAGTWATYDVATGGWSAERIAGDRHRSGAGCPTSSRTARRSAASCPAIAAEFDLPADTLIVTGAFDTYAAAVGSAAVDPGVVSLACGTWNSFNMPVTSGWPVELVHDGIGVYPHPGPTGFGILVTDPNGMAVVDWARSLLHLSIPDLEAGLAAAGPGPGHVFADAAFTPLPHVAATPGFGGTFSGVTLAATPVDIVRALLEGIACRFSLSLERLRGRGIGARLIRATGGGSKNAWWMQLIADLTGVPVEVVAQDEPGAFGAAILAGVGAGVYGSVSGGRRAARHRRPPVRARRGAWRAVRGRPRRPRERRVTVPSAMKTTAVAPQPAPSIALSTPGLVVDLDVFEANVAAMASLLPGTGKTLRPHVKTHRTPELARRQLGGSAVGLTCATVGEAEVDGRGRHGRRPGGERGGRSAQDRPAGGPGGPGSRRRRGGRSRTRSRPCRARPSRVRATIDVLIDVDILLHRCGVESAADAVSLAGAIDRAPGLRLRGIMGYEGRIRRSDEGRTGRIASAYAKLAEVRAAIIDAGFPVDVVSAAGTSTLDEALADPIITEVQAGVYALMEPERLEPGLPFRCAVAIRGTVISRHPGRVVVDVGRRVVGVEYGPPVPIGFVARDLWISDEHATIELDDPVPPLGSELDFAPGPDQDHLQPARPRLDQPWRPARRSLADRPRNVPVARPVGPGPYGQEARTCER